MSRSAVSCAILHAAALSAVCLMSVGTANATHFRYGHIIWKARPDIAPNTAEITLYASFRRGGYPGPPVIGSIISETIGDTTLNLGDGTSVAGPGGRLQFRVLAFDAAQDWIYTVALNPADANLPITHTYANPGPWTAQISSCCRISTLRNGPDGSYRVAALINFNTDVSSAVSTVPTIVNCASGTTCTFAVAAGDSDNDTLFWRLATIAESGGDMNNPPGLTINSSNGAVSWPTTGLQLGLWGVQVVIESRTAGGVLKSRVAVDFLLNLGTALPGGTAPVFAPPTLVCGVTLDLAAGKPFSFTVRALDSDAGDNVSLNAIGLPSGATMTPSLPTSGNPVQSVFNWTPTASQVATSVVIFTATDNAGRQTQCNAILQVRADRDGDGLPDIWETDGYTYNGQFVDLKALGANPDHKDVFVHIDYMAGLQPKQAALDKIVAAFAAVPNSLFAVPNPDGQDGIALHLVLGTEVPFQTNLGTTGAGGYNWSAFETLKNANFNQALQLAYHYCLFANIGPTTNGGANSGISRGIPSNDFLVTLGSAANNGTVDQQAGTFMHELGHNLGLGHGGPLNLAAPAGQVNTNYKPNYLSVMNYASQFSGLRKGPNFGHFDYSRMQLPSLNEAVLDETVGLNSALASGYGTVWYCGSARNVIDAANGPIDWNCDGVFTNGVSADINNGGGAMLASYNDWANLNFTGGSIGAGLALPQPIETPVEERTIQEAMSEPPPAPSSLTSRIVGSTARLAWNPVGQIGEFSYRVYRKTGTGPFELAATVAAPALTQALTPGTQYQFRVTAVNASGTESAPSNIVTLTP